MLLRGSELSRRVLDFTDDDRRLSDAFFMCDSERDYKHSHHHHHHHHYHHHCYHCYQLLLVVHPPHWSLCGVRQLAEQVQHPFSRQSTPPPQPFHGPFSGITQVSRCQKRTSGLMVQGKINSGRHTDHPDGRHSIRTNQCSPPPSRQSSGGG